MERPNTYFTQMLEQIIAPIGRYEYKSHDEFGQKGVIHWNEKLKEIFSFIGTNRKLYEQKEIPYPETNNNSIPIVTYPKDTVFNLISGSTGAAYVFLAEVSLAYSDEQVWINGTPIQVLTAYSKLSPIKEETILQDITDWVNSILFEKWVFEYPNCNPISIELPRAKIVIIGLKNDTHLVRKRRY